MVPIIVLADIEIAPEIEETVKQKEFIYFNMPYDIGRVVEKVNKLS